MTETSKKQIVILGSSYGGVSTAHYLLKHAVPVLPDKESYQITMVSPSTKTLCRPACPRAMISDAMFPQDKLFVNTAPLFDRYPKGSFRFVHGAATGLDHTARTVTVGLSAGGEEVISFYAVVIATGAATTSPLLGLHGDATDLKASWGQFRAALPNAKHIVIAGGGPAGIETAGELGEYLNGKPGWFASKPATPKVPITVVTAGPSILPILRPAIAKTALDYLALIGVTVHTKSRITAVSPPDAGTGNVASPATLTLEDGATLSADLYIPATGMAANTSFLAPELLAADGRVDTNPATLRVDGAGERVYAVGDVASAARPAVHLVFDEVPVLCANIKRDLQLAAGVAEASVGKEREFKENKAETQLVPLGYSSAVGAMMGWRLPSFLVWVLKGRDYWLWTTGMLWSGLQWTWES